MFTRLRNFFQHSVTSLKQYPGAYLVAIAIAVIAIIVNHSGYNGDRFDNVDRLVLVLLGLLFTLPLMVAGPLMREINPVYSRGYAFLSQGVALGLGLLFYFFVLPDGKIEMATGSEGIQIAFSFVLAWIASLGAIVIATKGERELVWGWCKQFIIAIVVAGLSAMIIRGGISASIASIEYLFDVVVHGEVYLDIGILSRSLLGVVIWLTRLQTNDDDRKYNKLFRFFGLYTFFPLTIVYMLILIAYACKIVVLRQWPHSGTVWLVGSYVAFSMVGYLLIYPLTMTMARLRKVKTVYFVSLIFFTTFLIIAISKRLEYHGFTVEEYFIAMLAIWMVVISIWTLAKRTRSLSVIILSFLVLLVISLYGPQSAMNLSTRMQSHYLMDMLAKNNFLTEDQHILPHTVTFQTGDVLTGDLKKIHTAVSYLVDFEGVDFFKPLYTGTSFDVVSGANSRDFADRFIVSLGVDESFISSYRGYEYDGSRYFSFYAAEIKDPLDIQSYSLMMPLETSIMMKISPDQTSKPLTVETSMKTYNIDLAAHLANIDVMKISSAQTTPLVFTGEDYKLILTQISGQKDSNDEIIVNYYKGFVLLR